MKKHKCHVNEIGYNKDCCFFLYSYYPDPMNVKMEIYNILYQFFLNEDDMWVIVHVLYALFDIYKDED